MPQPTDLPTPSAAKLPARLDFLGRAPLTLGDNTCVYDTLLARFFESVRPHNPVEEMWLREVVDLVWEAVRVRRLKAALMTACADQGVSEVLSTLQVRDYFKLTQRWAARQPEAIAEVEAILAAAGLNMDHVLAQTLRRRIGEVERFDRMIAAAEARRNVALREIAHYRAHFADDLRRAAQETIEDAEFEVVAPPLARQAAEGAVQDSAPAA